MCSVAGDPDPSPDHRQAAVKASRQSRPGVGSAANVRVSRPWKETSALPSFRAPWRTVVLCNPPVPVPLHERPAQPVGHQLRAVRKIDMA